MLRHISAVLLLAALVLLFSLFSCSDENAAPNEQQTPAGSGDPESTLVQADSEEEARPVPVLSDDLPDDLDFGGATVTILSRGHIRFEDDVTMEELNGEIVNDAVFNRQRLVEDRLNVRIVNVKSDEGGIHGPHEMMRRIGLAGVHEYDIFTASSYTAAPLGANGIFHNLYDIEHIDLSKPYWMQGYIENSQIGDKLFTISGDILLSVIRSSFAVFFNKQLLEQYEIEDPYELVRSGEWTIDKD